MIRRAVPADHAPLARLWHDAWHEAHAAHVPAALTRLRTIAEFEERVPTLPGLRVAGPEGAPLGLCAVRGDELYQLFVAPGARGTGTATALLSDGEARIGANHPEAWLDCVIENRRARRFYERMGWRLLRIAPESVDTSRGPFTFDLAVYGKIVGNPA